MSIFFSSISAQTLPRNVYAIGNADKLKVLQEENNRLQEENNYLRRTRGGAGHPSDTQGEGGNEGHDQKLKPDANYEGKSCVYFTKPAVANDGATLNYYGEGASVVYGKWMYKCENRHWSNKGPASIWSKSDVERLSAEKLEQSTINSRAFFEKD